MFESNWALMPNKIIHNSFQPEHHSDETIISEGFKSVKILRLNRPDKQNAFNRSMLESLARELNSFEQDDSASVAVIHGMGGNFSSGYDLDELQTVAKNAPQELEKSLIVSVSYNLLVRKAILTVHCIPLKQFPYQRKTTKPILCGVSGVCKSIGFEIALMCDIRILENSSKLAFTDLELGIPHLANGPKLLANFIDRAAVIRLLTFSSEINSGEALEMGITKCDVVEDGTGKVFQFFSIYNNNNNNECNKYQCS